MPALNWKTEYLCFYFHTIEDMKIVALDQFNVIRIYRGHIKIHKALCVSVVAECFSCGIFGGDLDVDGKHRVSRHNRVELSAEKSVPSRIVTEGAAHMIAKSRAMLTPPAKSHSALISLRKIGILWGHGWTRCVTPPSKGFTAEINYMHPGTDGVIVESDFTARSPLGASKDVEIAGMGIAPQRFLDL